MIVQKGQKVELTKGRILPELVIGLTWHTSEPSMDINASAFLLNHEGRCTRDDDMIFYNQQSGRQGAVRHSYGEDGQMERIHISFGKIPPDIDKIGITLTIHEGEMNGKNFSMVRNASCLIYDPFDGEQVATFHFGDGLNLETAIVVGELYIHNGDWKFNAVGSGFHGGLAALVTNYGLALEDATEEAAAAVEEPPMPLKLDLKKQESINIKKSEKVTATLEWKKDKDLDLYCFYVTKDNEIGKIYYRNLGSALEQPYIQLYGDALSHGKETIVIHRPEALKYILFAAYSALSNGIGSFKSMKVRAVVDNHQGQVVTTPLHQKSHLSYWVAIAHIDFTDPKQMCVSHVEQYSRKNVERSPLLYADGTFAMDVGPEEFK